jgi:hypothetical protein
MLVSLPFTLTSSLEDYRGSSRSLHIASSTNTKLSIAAVGQNYSIHSLFEKMLLRL